MTKSEFDKLREATILSAYDKLRADSPHASFHHIAVLVAAQTEFSDSTIKKIAKKNGRA